VLSVAFVNGFHLTKVCWISLTIKTCCGNTSGVDAAPPPHSRVEP